MKTFQLTTQQLKLPRYTKQTQLNGVDKKVLAAISKLADNNFTDSSVVV